MGGNRGFSLIELSFAAAITLIVVMGAFVWISRASDISAAQGRIADITSQGRVVLDLIGRDIRSAGDSVQLLPDHCMGGIQPPNPQFGCAAILEPHPWRITLARYAWDPGPDGIESTADDGMPSGAFDENPSNVVTYQFIPRGGLENLGGTRTGYVGRIERVINPFSFGGAAPQVDVLLEDVVLDDEMSVSPGGDAFDHRKDYALFLYSILSVSSGEYDGAATYTNRSTKEGSFLLPPVRLFEFPDDPVAWVDDIDPAPPYVSSTYVPEIVGLDPDTTARTVLRPGKTFAQDLRYVLDFNRIRAVRIAFKVVERRDDPSFQDGIDLDSERPGTVRASLLESTFELKSLSSYLQ